MEDHFNQLTPAEAERLAILAEECGEVIQIVGKILRHGYKDVRFGLSGRERLEQKCGHVHEVMLRLCHYGDLSKEAIHKSASQIGRDTHH